jgi:molybdopterin/thiamine biosynthesis adenylyltransferase
MGDFVTSAQCASDGFSSYAKAVVWSSLDAAAKKNLCTDLSFKTRLAWRKPALKRFRAQAACLLDGHLCQDRCGIDLNH